MDEQAYLEPDFDPSTLTVPRLRSILVAHGVNYPSSAKKNNLIELFNSEVVPQARQIRSANARVKRTSRGIVDVPSSQSTVNDDDDEEEEEEVAPARRPPSTSRRSAGRASRSRTEEAQEVQPTPRASRHSTAPPEGSLRRVSSKHGRPAENPEPEQEPKAKRPASRSSRLSAATPSMRQEPDDHSPFSNDNVFQSGSSPPAPSANDRRRTTQSSVKELERRKSREMRRRTDEVKPMRAQTGGAVVPSRKTFDMPVSQVRKNEPEFTEEFTPEEQQELVQSQQAGELVPARRRTKTPGSNTVRNGLGSVAIALVIGMAALWVQEKFNVGYCGVGQPSTEIAGVSIPEQADFIRPQCESCPPHAICNEKFETSCEPGFVLTQHPLSLYGMLPVPPSCEPDSTKARKVKAVKERAVEELRQQNAKYECGEATSPEVKETKLKEAISSQRRKGMSNEEFEDLWNWASHEVANADGVSSSTDGSGHFTLRSSSLARVPLSCAIRRSLYQTLREYVWQLIAILFVLGSASYGRYAITSGRETEARAKQLAGLALEKLSLQAALHASDPDTYRENYMSMAQLRDDVLRDEFSSTRRKKLWEKVQQKVEYNSNVRPTVREGRSGDVGRVWEWVGAVGLLESPPQHSGERRKSGRVSFGGERFIEPGSERDDSTETSAVARWQEQRSYY